MVQQHTSTERIADVHLAYVGHSSYPTINAVRRIKGFDQQARAASRGLKQMPDVQDDDRLRGRNDGENLPAPDNMRQLASQQRKRGMTGKINGQRSVDGLVKAFQVRCIAPVS